MSLNVYLEADAPRRVPPRRGIFIRENGATREISREEWDRRYPDREPVSMLMPEESRTLHEANITHNLGAMATAAGIYEALWCPEEIGVSRASGLVTLLREGLARLQADPPTYHAHNPPNGWGDYDGLVQFVADYLRACEAHPDAWVRVSR